MRRTRVPCKVTSCTKLRSAQRSPELALRRTDFCAPVNLLFPAMSCTVDRSDKILDFLSENKYLKSSRGIASVVLL